MGKQNIHVATFNGGEVDKKTLARADIDIYSRFAETMENVFPYVQGEMSKAPGSKYIAEVTALAELNDEAGGVLLDEAGEALLSEGESLAILRPFVRSGSTAYVLELSANQLRFIDNSSASYVMLDGADATIGAWSDESAAPDAGGGAPIDPGSSDVGDPFYVDIDYDWIVTSEGGYGVITP